ncbi:DoxX family protein [Mucilaginibacter mali]|uniref:DoxX family protein n=1 Tax=Mucilaginibacter mali TaxID=2740462 RepID=A0A7D4QKX4_9SPHI|nr:DoxX family protein [Mucilaginibacter mali]QKJ30810.1 DoxX family protein [Mucilaginibacter mali]
MHKLKNVSIGVLVLGYFGAGINHFVHPEGYIHIIPAYIPFPKLMNVLAGSFEVLFALMLTFSKTRTIAVWGIILMLAAFMPVHIQMVIDAPFMLGSLHVTKLGAWIRVLLQPVLMVWVWWHRK